MSNQIAEAFVRVRYDTDATSRASLDRTVKRDLGNVERQLKSTNREMTRFSRGALVGTGALQSIGRAAAFASLSFIGGAGLALGIRSTIQAAMESQVVLGQTENAVKRAGLSWETYGQQVQDAALAQAQISGFDDERLLRTFSTFVRVTKDENQALKLNALAANVARGRNIELEQASQLVIKASLGQAGALRRIGIDAKEGASRVELLALINEKYAGSAAKFADTAAGAQARFNVAVQNTQEAIGTALLPTLTTYLDKATEWLNDTGNQERIQRATNDAVRITAQGVDILATSIGGLTKAIQFLHNLPGGDVSGLDILRSARQRDLSFDYLASNPQFLKGLTDAPGGSLIDLLTGRTGTAAAAGSTDPFSDAVDRPGSRVSSRNERTATDLARAQATGIRAQIEAAARARQMFVQDTIRFANQLISQGRGDTGKLQTTLQAFYGEQESLKGIFRSFADADKQSADDAAQAALDRAEQWRQSNHAIQEAFAAARREGRAYAEKFSASVRQEAEDQRARLTNKSDLALLLLQNRVTAAGLAGGPAAQRQAEIDAQRSLIAGLGDRVKFLRRMHAGQLEVTRAVGDVISAKVHLRDLLRTDPGAKKKSAAGGFSLAELFGEATSEFAQYGSNIGGPLSAQDARGAFAGVVKTHQTMVVQNFYMPVPSSQAMVDARNAAKNLR